MNLKQSVAGAFGLVGQEAAEFFTAASLSQDVVPKGLSQKVAEVLRAYRRLETAESDDLRPDVIPVGINGCPNVVNSPMYQGDTEESYRM